MQACISTTIFGRKPLAECIDPLEKAGFRWIEVSRKSEDWASAVDPLSASGLKVWAVHGKVEMAAVTGSADERGEALARAMELVDEAAAFGRCPYVIHYLHRSHDEKQGRIWREVVEQLLERTSSRNLNLSVETPPYKPERYSRHNDSLEVAEFVRSFHRNDISVCVDLNHANLREDLVKVARNCRGLISNIHVSDNHGHQELHLPPGEGLIDFPRAVEALVEAGYIGPINLEVHMDEEPDVETLVRLREWAERVGLSGS